MPSLNFGKFLIGGFGAGLVISLIDWASNNYLLVKDWQNVAQARNIDPLVMGSMTSLVTFIAADFIYGFLIVWTYSAIKPKFGPGRGTASIAAFGVFVPVAAVMATFAGIFFPWDIYIRSMALLLVAMVAGAIAGGWVYTDKSEFVN